MLLQEGYYSLSALRTRFFPASPVSPVEIILTHYQAVGFLCVSVTLWWIRSGAAHTVCLQHIPQRHNPF